MEHTRLRRQFMDYVALAAGRDNTTTAAEMCALLDRLRQPQYASLLALLRRAVGDGKLEAGIPPGTPIAHKVGDLPGVEHDAGVIFAPNGPYIVAALSVNLPDIERGRQTIAAASRLVWQLMHEEPRTRN
jgi:beta-lactamase class A